MFLRDGRIKKRRAERWGDSKIKCLAGWEKMRNQLAQDIPSMACAWLLVDLRTRPNLSNHLRSWQETRKSLESIELLG